MIAPRVIRTGLAATALVLVATPVLTADPTGGGNPTPELQALAAAAAWRDSLEAVRVPALPPPGATESAIVLFRQPALAWADPRDRAAALVEIDALQARVTAALAGLGAEVNFRYRLLVNGVGIRVPSGRLDAVARLPEVEAVIPVSYLAPAQSDRSAPAVATADVAPAAPVPPADGRRPAHIALVDAGIDARHPWLGGAIGPTSPIIGGYDFVDGDADPTATSTPPSAEAHGTAMAGLVLRSPDLAGLPPDRVPRLLAYRVVAPEAVDGRVRPLARTDRLLAALERAVDPNGDGRTDDRAEVILLGLARGFDGGGIDPVARALTAAERFDAVVVVPSGNDGPTFGPVGTVGAVAAAPGVLSVGGRTGGVSPRTARLGLMVDPTEAELSPLPLLGAPLAEIVAPIVFLRGANGLATGNEQGDFFRDGVSLVSGAVVVVARGGGQLVDKARNAAAAGARAIAVWDESGSSAFPGTTGGDDWPLPTIGLGGAQGRALSSALAAKPELSVRLTALAVDSDAPRVASFSSRGPTADGRLKPDVAAESVDLVAPYPGFAVDGRPLVTRFSGTSGAAAAVAARALRLRIDNPELRPEDVRSVLVQSAESLSGATSVDQGAGALPATPGALPAVAIDPPIVTRARPVGGVERVRFTLHDLTGRGGRYQVMFQSDGGDPRPLGGPVDVPPGVRVGLSLRLPGGDGALQGELTVVPASAAPDATPVARAPLFIAPPAAATPNSLGEPRVRVRPGVTDVTVRLGILDGQKARVTTSVLHGTRLWLVPSGGGAPLAIGGMKRLGDTAAGEYRFLLSRRLADGRSIVPGRYRVRITAAGSDGTTFARDSAVFAIR